MADNLYQLTVGSILGEESPEFVDDRLSVAIHRYSKSFFSYFTSLRPRKSGCWTFAKYKSLPSSITLFGFSIPTGTLHPLLHYFSRLVQKF